MDGNKINYFSSAGKIITFDIIVQHVCDVYSVKREKVFDKSRKREFLDPRQIIHYLCKKYMPRTSLAKIGELSGGWRHATVLNSNRNVKNLSDTDSFYRKRLELIENNIIITA